MKTLIPKLAGLPGLALVAALALALVGCSGSSNDTPAQPTTVQFAYTSDSHYGITRTFQGTTGIDATVVNRALVTKMNALPTATFPADSGVQAGKTIGAFDFVVNTGDLANRMEGTKPTAGTTAATMWAQAQADYLTALTLKTAAGTAAPVFLVPGNHDVSNAVGYYKPSTPYPVDPTSYIGIYNLMMKPATPLTASAWGTTFTAAGTSYSANKVYYSRDVNGVHFIFINMWPEKSARDWMETDLAKVSATTPVILFTHDQPDVETKHLTNPNGGFDINATDKFENLVADKCTDPDASSKLSIDSPSTTQQRALAAFLKAHKNIVAYFHGNDNQHQAYVWQGPDSDIAVNIFRVDSPMKGNISGSDETKLSFHVVTLDTAAKSLTVREYLWNNTAAPWGTPATVSIAVPRAK
jgi:3',5'-cyclic AMP phosphodiesterase CpdA